MRLLYERFFSPTDLLKDLGWAHKQLHVDGSGADRRASDCSFGRITSIDLLHRRGGGGRRPDRNGIFCQRVFGPVDRLSCACGTVVGDGNEGACCERCGVFCTADRLRGLRHGHVQVSGVVHPQLFPLIAEALSITPADVRSVAQATVGFLHDASKSRSGHQPLSTLRPVEDIEVEENDPDPTGPLALVQALKSRNAPADLISIAVFQSIPVPPPDARPFVAPTTPTQVDPWIGPVNEAWRSVVLHANRQLRLNELSVPPVILRSEQRLMQQVFEDVCTLTVADHSKVTRVWPAATGQARRTSIPLLGMPTTIPHELGDTIFGLFFVDEGRILVQRPKTTFLLDTSGKVLKELSGCGRVATSIQGSLVRMDRWCGKEWDWFGEDEYWELKSGRSSVAVLDVDRGEYLTAYPADWPLRLVESDQPEDLVVHDETADPAPAQIALLRWGGDRPSIFASTRDARFAWVGEASDTAVLDLDTGIPQLDPVLTPEYNDGDQVVRLDDDEYEIDDGCEDGAVALAITPQNHLRLLHGAGAVSDGTRVLFWIPAEIGAAAFNPAANRLAVSVGEEILVISVTSRPKVVARFPSPV